MFNFKLFSWNSKKSQPVDSSTIPSSFIIPNEHKLVKFNMDVDDDHDLVDINIKPLSYAEAALLNADKPTTVISMNKPVAKKQKKPVDDLPLQDSIEFYPVKINHHQRNKHLKKKYKR